MSTGNDSRYTKAASSCASTMDETTDGCLTPTATTDAGDDDESAAPLQEVQNVIGSIRKAITQIHSASLEWYQSRTPKPDTTAESYASNHAEYVVKIVDELGSAIEALEKEQKINSDPGRAMLAHCVVTGMTQTLASLTRLEEDGPLSQLEMKATAEALSYKCYIKIKEQLMPQLKQGDCYGPSGTRLLQSAINLTMSSFTEMGVPRSGRKLVADLLSRLVTHYVQSLLDLEHTVRDLSVIYVRFARATSMELPGAAFNEARRNRFRV